jgi:hypothetical protein
VRRVGVLYGLIRDTVPEVAMGFFFLCHLMSSISSRGLVFKAIIAQAARAVKVDFDVWLNWLRQVNYLPQGVQK